MFHVQQYIFSGGMFLVKGAMVNVIAIIIGSGIGLLLRMGISESYKNTIMHAMGLSVLLISIKMALVSQNTLVFILSLQLTLTSLISYYPHWRRQHSYQAYVRQRGWMVRSPA